MPALYAVTWGRVILDEAHMIRETQTHAYHAICALDAQRRWACTGTPVVNRLDDVYALVRFLQLRPWSSWTFWKTWLTQPMATPVDDPRRAGHRQTALQLLQRLMAPLLIRRYKHDRRADGQPIVVLPEKIVEVRYLEMQADEREVYETLMRQSSRALRHLRLAGHATYPHVFALLMRLRQCCDHLRLVRFRELKARRSAKIDALLALLASARRDAPDGRMVVFSQWTRMLHVCRAALAAHGFHGLLLDGRMSAAARERTLRQFPPRPFCVLLASLRAVGVGVNLTAAASAVLLDPWWNESTEQQAIDRIHRVGQTRPVRVWRFIVRDSVEEKLLAIQKRKAALAVS
ncbi:hypothetical protein CXG81DRAFT_15724 [Caulochytrium protostelioides]|uniref:Helicase C-terminal domain-containing protein n=1 Tax=Caulochytrium protostelioides TaxID=1555241 RepID=A0A4P9X1A3_9FUNG|nr:hypothetical protein CXG81DRAFT_15724 [Caulochytrium protostelioides]|eukprot:RKO98588.1 hypothetical protein CXG81DRAFT_15724 [Caulochytrium protostelioides]